MDENLSLQAPLADAQLLRLEQLLADPGLDRAMRLDEAQGYLCAAVSGPRPIAADEWLIEVLGSAAWNSSNAGREAAELLRLFAMQLQAELASGDPPMLLLYPADENEDPASDYGPWCHAYLHGIDSAPEDWFESLGAADDREDSEEIAYLDEQLFPLFMLTGDAEAAAGAAGEEWLSGSELERLREECEDKLPQAVTHIYRFWMARRSVQTVRHEVPKVGRNEPCPCGSGRKFKKCCGAVQG